MTQSIRCWQLIFQSWFASGKSAGSASICFFNGCATSAGFFDNSFLVVSSMPGFHGFIEDEAEVSNKFATRYALEFLTALCGCESTLQEVLQGPQG